MSQNCLFGSRCKTCEARPRCRWAVAGGPTLRASTMPTRLEEVAKPARPDHDAGGRQAEPDWASRRRAEPHVSTPGATGVEGAGGTRSPAAVPVGGGRAWPSIMATRRTTRQHARRRRCGGRRRGWRAREGLAAVPVGGGGAWPGFEATRRAKLAARTARGRAAAHGHTKQPGPAGARNTRGATATGAAPTRPGIQKPTSGSDVGLRWS